MKNLNDNNIQEIREIILDSNSSRKYQNRKIKEWFVCKTYLDDWLRTLAEMKAINGSSCVVCPLLGTCQKNAESIEQCCDMLIQYAKNNPTPEE